MAVVNITVSGRGLEREMVIIDVADALATVPRSTRCPRIRPWPESEVYDGADLRWLDGLFRWEY